MSSNLHDPWDSYSQYEEQFDPIYNDRQARRKRRPKVHHEPKKTLSSVVEDIAEDVTIEAGFRTTYQPSLYEAEWLLQSLRTFYDRDLIVDVLALVKGGKEANVYACQAHPSTGYELLAAKVYRPRKFRTLRNDQQYRQGRGHLNAAGKQIKERDRRMLKALDKGTALGQQIEHTSWLMYEYTMLTRLHQNEADVPVPIASGENALLMSYIGELYQPAPTLHEWHPPRAEAQRLFDCILHNVELLLRQGYVHGDLSAYNILYWRGQITLIDFPQVIDIHTNPDAPKLFQRDIQRVCDYFSRQGVSTEAKRIADALWSRYGPGAEPNINWEDEGDDVLA